MKRNRIPVNVIALALSLFLMFSCAVGNEAPSASQPASPAPTQDESPKPEESGGEASPPPVEVEAVEGYIAERRSR